MGVFAPFKWYFKRYRDAWSVNNKGKGASKQTLAMWVSKALERALITRNIIAGFRTTGIFPLNSKAVNAHMGPARQFASLPSTMQPGVSSGGRAGSGAEGATAAFTEEGTGRGRSDDDDESRTDSISSGTSDVVLQQMRGNLIPESQPQPVQHYYVGAAPSNAGDSDFDDTSSQHSL